MTVWNTDALSVCVPAAHMSRQQVVREELITVIGRRGSVGPAAARAPSWLSALNSSFSPSTYPMLCAFANLALLLGPP